MILLSIGFSWFSGMCAVPDEEVIKAHHGTKLSVDVVGYLGRTSNMFQFVDIFSIPEITLLRDVTQVSQQGSSHFVSPCDSVFY